MGSGGLSTQPVRICPPIHALAGDSASGIIIRVIAEHEDAGRVRLSLSYAEAVAIREAIAFADFAGDLPTRDAAEVRDGFEPSRFARRADTRAWLRQVRGSRQECMGGNQLVALTGHANQRGQRPDLPPTALATDHGDFAH